MSSSPRNAEISSGPAARTMIAASGSAVRVTNDPKKEIVPADQSRTKSRSRQSDRRASEVVRAATAGL